METPIPAALRAAMLALLLSSGDAAWAKTPDWSVDPHAAANPAYAASRAVCRKLAAVAPPMDDAPTPAEAASLADCSSEALLYGIGRPADPRAARLCATVETRVADPQVTDFGFTGIRTQMIVYANGVGAGRDLDVATALACRSGGTPEEIDSRVRHLARLRSEGWTGTTFSLCDDAASDMVRGICADHDQLIARSDRTKSFAALSAGWSAADRAAFAPLKRAEAAFVDARGQAEGDRSGSGRGPAMVAAEERAERDFTELLVDAEAGRIATASPADAKAAQEILDSSFAGLMARVPGLARTTSITAAGLVSSQRSWLRYRDAWLSFARVRYSTLAPEALLTRLTRARADQVSVIRSVAE